MIIEPSTLSKWQEAAPDPSARRLSYAERLEKARSTYGDTARFKFLTADGQAATPLEHEALLGTNDLVEANFLDRCRLVMTCVGRLKFISPRGRGYATGFMIAPGLMMTNHHVFGDPGAAAGASLEFGYQYDVAGKLSSGAEFDLKPDEFFVADKTFDFAVVAVAPMSTTNIPLADRRYLRLNPEPGKVTKGDFVTIVQHPDGLPMRIALRENEVTKANPDEDVVWYEADTAHGSSGAPVFNDSFQIAALHSSGRIKRNAAGQFAHRNGTFVDSLDGLAESDVIWEANVGMRVSRICPRLLDLAKVRSLAHHDRLRSAMNGGGDVLAAAVETVSSDVNVAEREIVHELTGGPEMAESVNSPGVVVPAGTRDLVIPLQLRVSLEIGGAVAPSLPATTPAVAVAPAGDAGLLPEAFEMRLPVIYDELEERTGFSRQFLDLPGGADVPMPQLTANGKKAVAPLVDGSGSELKYHKFSVWMHKRRRLALFTASNVDWRARKSVVDGKKTDRTTLAGFPPNKTILELWASDTRIAPEHQLPDVFYTEDRGAFDKGHLVRRDDMCWGNTFEDIQMGNGDTYHVTNCSPQTKPFNQGTAGEENWGDLETHIQKATKKDNEKVIIYAGPIYRADDRWFKGKDDAGTARIQIPTKYWKVVVTNDAGTVKAYGFELRQDVTKVTTVTEEEFFVTDEWLGSMKRIKDIQSQMRGWLSLSELIPFDQFDAVRNP